jgi:acyl-CoA synthetase (NDP forming)
VRRQGPSAASSPAGPDPLDALFSPRTVAIVGASADSAKWGHIIAQRALASPGDRTVLLVNRHGGEVLGHPTYPSARAAAAAHERTVDLAVLCVPAASWPR